jgi:hypothetical protein
VPLTQDDRAPLALGQGRERLLDPGERSRLALRRGKHLLERVQVAGDVYPRAAVVADVLGDPAQPRVLEARTRPPSKRAERVEEDGLSGVLGFLAAAEPPQAEGVDLRSMSLVEVAGGVGGGGSGGAHGVVTE